MENFFLISKAIVAVCNLWSLWHHSFYYASAFELKGLTARSFSCLQEKETDSVVWKSVEVSRNEITLYRPPFRGAQAVSSWRHSKRTVDGDGVSSRWYSKHSADSEGVLSQRYSDRPADGEGAISRRDSKQIARDSCGHKRQSVWCSGEAASKYSLTEWRWNCIVRCEWSTSFERRQGQGHEPKEMDV